jgi:hypothetical protein
LVKGQELMVNGRGNYINHGNYFDFNNLI